MVTAIIAETAPIDWQVSINTLLTAGGFVVGIAVYVTNMRSTARVFNMRLNQVDDSIRDFRLDLKELQKVIVNQALQSERLNNMESRGVAQGKRLDEATRRLDDFLDRFARSSLSPMRQSSD